MLQIVKQTLHILYSQNRVPTTEELQISNPVLLQKKGTVFVTLYKNGNIIGNSGNVVEIEENIVQELVKNTVYATQDLRFDRTNANDLPQMNVRIDVITSRNILDTPIENLNPTTSWLLVIKKDYSKLSVILPNISPTLVSGKEMISVLSAKLDEPFQEADYIVYEIHTQAVSDF